MDYYNEHDPFAAAWLRELMAAGEIPPGDVDERDIQDVQPSGLVGYRHCHFFAGIGGWAYAMRLAEWPDDVPLWTGSCPCQPFSAAGQGAGFADERHLWPAFHWLIQQCRPRYVCGEQVASADALQWWDLVATDMEGAGYACTAVDLPAASVGAPHKRSRLFWLADAQYEQQHWRWRTCGRRKESANHSTVGMANTSDHGCSGGRRPKRVSAATGQSHACGHQPDGCGDGGEWVGDTNHARLEGRAAQSERAGECATWQTSLAGHWSDCIWLPCTDGKARPTQPSIQPLAYGVPNRVGTLRGAGNAIVPQAAAEVLRAWREVMR